MTEENSMSNWIQDNLRIIISVGIVILLVFAIYSYSNRNSRTDVVVDDSQIEEVAMTATDDGSSQEINEIIDEIKDEEAQKDTTLSTEDAERMNSETDLEQKIAEETQEIVEETKTIEERLNKENEEDQSAKDAVRDVIESRSKQKEGVTVVVAIPGDSVTTLARKANAEYVRKNNIDGLTPAHKIYIEDYLRKAVNAPQIHSGTEMEFSHELINTAIESSKTLTDAQLRNLDKYVQNVSVL